MGQTSRYVRLKKPGICDFLGLVKSGIRRVKLLPVQTRHVASLLQKWVGINLQFLTPTHYSPLPIPDAKLAFFPSHIQHQIKNTIGISPLVVIPRNNLKEVRI